MPRNAQIVLDDELGAFVDRQVSDGNYGSADDVIRAGLRRLRDDDAKLEALRAALIEGEESGEPADFDFDTFLDEMNMKYGSKG